MQVHLQKIYKNLHSQPGLLHESASPLSPTELARAVRLNEASI